MIFHFELPQSKRVSGLEQAVYDIVSALNDFTHQTHARVGEYTPNSLRGVQAVHFHGIWDMAHMSVAKRCRELNIPYIVSPHGMLEPWPLRHKPLRKWVHRALFTNRYLRGAQFILATSDMEAEQLKRLFPDQTIHNLPLGIDKVPPIEHPEARRNTGVKPDRFLILFLSRIDAKKNLDGLLHALLRLDTSTAKKISLAVIGKGEGRYYQECINLGKQCRERGIEIQWLGLMWGNEKWYWLSGSDLCALPSLSENFGYVYLESLAVGTPILCTPHTPWGRINDPESRVVCQTDVDAIVTGLKSGIERFSQFKNRSKVRENTHREYHWEALARRYAPLYPSPPEDTFTHAPF